MSAQSASGLFLPLLAGLSKSRGASRLEALIVIVLISIVAAFLLERLTRYQEYAEKVVMEATIANVRSGLRVRVAELMISGRTAQMGDLLQENPIRWLAAPPPNYAGALTHGATEAPAAGSWYFDVPARQLVYLPQHHRFFRPGVNGKREVRWQVLPLPASPFPIAAVPPPSANAKMEGIALRILQSYEWNDAI